MLINSSTMIMNAYLGEKESFIYALKFHQNRSTSYRKSIKTSLFFPNSWTPSPPALKLIPCLMLISLQKLQKNFTVECYHTWHFTTTHPPIHPPTQSYLSMYECMYVFYIAYRHIFENPVIPSSNATFCFVPSPRWINRLAGKECKISQNNRTQRAELP